MGPRMDGEWIDTSGDPLLSLRVRSQANDGETYCFVGSDDLASGYIVSFGSLHPGMDRDEESPSSAAGVGASHSTFFPARMNSIEKTRVLIQIPPGALGRKGVL